MTAILTAQLSNTAEKHKIIEGYNYGSLRDKCNNNTLTILSFVIDTAKLKRKQFLFTLHHLISKSA